MNDKLLSDAHVTPEFLKRVAELGHVTRRLDPASGELREVQISTAATFPREDLRERAREQLARRLRT